MHFPAKFSAAAAAPSFDPAQLTVLLIDDEPELLRIYRLLLESAGFRILTASSGRDAMRIALRERPSLIFCDLTMPGMDGLEFLRALRRAKTTRNIPLAFLSGSTVSDEMREQAERLEVAEFVAKPCSAARLRSVIESLSGRFDLLQENFSVVNGRKLAWSA